MSPNRTIWPPDVKNLRQDTYIAAVKRVITDEKLTREISGMIYATV